MIPKREVKARLDGYMIGDRLLEGVMFDVVVTINPNELENPDENNVTRVESVTLDPEAIPYIKSLGGPGAVKYWEDEARKACDPELVDELLFEGELLSPEEEKMIEDSWKENV